MKIQTLYKYLREEQPALLAQEAARRWVRPVRRWQFRNTIQRGNCPVRFRPIGYYQWQKEPVPERVRGSILDFADAILKGQYPLMGYGNPHLGSTPDWQCDWVSGKRWPMEPSSKLRTIGNDGSDVKAPWELSRLQFAPVIAKAHALTGDKKYRLVLKSLTTDWILRNPVGIGVNWTIAMEAALRGISLCLTMDLLWPFTIEEQPWLDLLTESLWHHVLFIKAHNEFSYLVRSNHYLSNIVGLTTLSAHLDGIGMKQQFEKYAGAVQREVLIQTYQDGGDFEASTGYHVLVAQMFLHSLVVQQKCGITIGQEFEKRLGLMFKWMAALVDQESKLPHLGDCDDGRVELLFEDIRQSALPISERHSLQVSGLLGLASHLLNLSFSNDITDAIWFGRW